MAKVTQADLKEMSTDLYIQLMQVFANQTTVEELEEKVAELSERLDKLETQTKDSVSSLPPNMELEEDDLDDPDAINTLSSQEIRKVLNS